MNQINIRQAETALWWLVERVAEGEKIIIAKSGKPVARLVPYTPKETVRRPGAMRVGFASKRASTSLFRKKCSEINPGSENNMAGELILIVEDNEKNRKLARDVLQVKGYQTIESETAEEGLELARNRSPALILMDIQLPGMDGITAMKQLKADVKTKSIPIIAVTASAMTNNRTAMLAEGFDGYQTKPISLKDFLGEIQRVLALVK